MDINIFHSHTKVFGLQLGDTALRAIELGKTADGKMRVVAASEVLLPKGVIHEDGITDAGLLASSIERLLERPVLGKFTTKNVVVNLAEPKCFVRVIHLQHMSESEITSAIPFEAESYIPIPIDQVYLDWQKLSEASGRMEILLIASAKEYVDKVVASIERAGLVPAALEVESQSVSRLAVAPGQTANSIIVNIQAGRTDLVMIERGNIQFTSTIPLGGNAITEALARGLGITSAAAETIKRKFGIANTVEYPNLKTILMPVLENFISEIKNTLAFHAQHSTEKVSTIALTGSGCQLKNLDSLVGAAFQEEGMVVACVNIPQTIILPPELSAPKFAPLAYSTAFGLAMRPVD